MTTSSLAVDAGDRYLLCSDGLNGQAPDADIEAVLGESAGSAAAADELVHRANRAGGVDNVSVIVVDVSRSRRPSPGTRDDRPRTPRPPGARRPSRLRFSASSRWRC